MKDREQAKDGYVIKKVKPRLMKTFTKEQKKILKKYWKGVVRAQEK